MATISSIGLSGLPLSNLLENLRTNESQILNVIQDRQTAAQARSDAYGKLIDLDGVLARDGCGACRRGNGF